MYFLCKNRFYFYHVYSVDPDEMQYFSAFHLGSLFPKVLFKGFPEYKAIIN